MKRQANKDQLDRQSLALSGSLGHRFQAAVLSVALGLPAAHAQFRPDYREMVADAQWQHAGQAQRSERQRYEAMLAGRSARAHARMLEEGGFSAGLIGAADWQAAHPNVFDSGLGIYNGYTYVAPPRRYTFRSSTGLDFPIWQDVAPESEPIESLYGGYISGPIVQARCVACHVAGGVSDAPNSRLQFSPSTVVNYMELNRAVFESLVAVLDEDDEIEDPVAYILNKVSGGIAHQGGTPVSAGTADYANLERFLRQVAEESGSIAPGLTPETLFEGVTMASPARTLRRAAILFDGRLPTQAELGGVADGEESSLRRAIRDLMNGEGFHDFLIRASNDRLLTDRQIHDGVIELHSHELVALNNKFAAMLRGAISRGNEDPWDDPDYRDWRYAIGDGFARAPLELIAHVVEKDLPYTEILTADYVMANPMAAEAYGATTQFDNVNDPYEFKPSEFARYYRNDESRISEFDEQIDIHVVTNPGNLLVDDYPHAGILNANAYLIRYPSTATNRNRARSRWTYYHFLGHDIEKSNPRPTNPEALVDENNPTLNNPACVACHEVLDPVAGAFQNYGDEGMYREESGGLDSLPRLYKDGQTGASCSYVYGDTWYCDMRDPGFGDRVAPSADSSVQWLAQQIVADGRFAEAAVKFWWQPIMGANIVQAPTDSSDPNFRGRSLAAQAQAAEVNRIAAAFRTGIDGGSAYNGKDLLTEIALSPWFRAESVTGSDPVRMAALRDAGVERLLTPEELNRKTEAVSGYVWGRRFQRTMNTEQAQARSYLEDDRRISAYELLYGGIDSDGITNRSVDVTPVMAAVAQSHAAEVSCPIVRREFFFWEDGNRRLFNGISQFDTPVSETYGVFDVTADTWEARQTFSLDVPLVAGPKTIRLAYPNDFEDEENGEDRNLNVDRIDVRDSTGTVIASIELESLGEGPCRSPVGHFDSFYRFWCGTDLSVALDVSHDDVYRIDIVAHQDAAGEEPARLSVVVESDDGVSAGSAVIRSKLVELHSSLLGVEVDPDSPDIDEAFNVFFEVWARKRRTEGGHFGHSTFQCYSHHDFTYYDGFVEDPVEFNQWGDSDLKWDLIDALYEQTDMSDPSYSVRAWVVTLAYLMTDYRYLYL